MKKYTLFTFIIIILLAISMGCINQKPEATPTPTIIPTPQPTTVPTTITSTPLQTTVVTLPTTYIVWIDTDYGFYRIRAVMGNISIQLPSDFAILNFTINIGDKVRWMNDDSYDFPFTLVSNEGLWTGRSGYLRWQGERFEYNFN